MTDRNPLANNGNVQIRYLAEKDTGPTDWVNCSLKYMNRESEVLELPFLLFAT